MDRAVTNKSRRLVLILASFSLTIIAGLAYNKSDEKMYYSKLYYTSLILTSVLNILSLTHPQQIFRRFCYNLSYINQLVAVPLTVWDVQLISNKTFDYMTVVNWVNYIAIIVTIGYQWTGGSAKILNTAFIMAVVSSIAMLMYILLAVNDCYWTIGMICLVVLHHFAFPRYTREFDISLTELNAIGQCFTALFAFNLASELSNNY